MKIQKVLGKTLLLKNVTKQGAQKNTGFQMTGMEQARLLYQEAEIVLAGDEVKESLKEGTRVLYNRGSGHDMVFDDVMYRIVQEREVGFILDNISEV